MRFISFDEATSFIPCESIENGKPVSSAISFYSEAGFVVTRVELSKEELKSIRDNGGRFYVIQGPDATRPMPFGIQAASPFKPAEKEKPAGKIVGLDGKPLN